MPPPLPILWIATALAGATHSGVPLDGHEGFEPPHFQSSKQGFTLDFPDGIARIYGDRRSPQPKNGSQSSWS